MKMPTLVLACAAGLLPAAALAAADAPLPAYNATDYCKRVAEKSGRTWDAFVCTKREQVTKEEVLPLWKAAASKVQETCNIYSSDVGGSYVILQACLRHYAGQLGGTRPPDPPKPLTF